MKRCLCWRISLNQLRTSDQAVRARDYVVTMDTRASSPHAKRFGWPDQSFGGMAGATTVDVIASSSDVAMVLDGDGVIRDVAFGSEEILDQGYDGWVGQPWVETVTRESRPKIEALLRDAAGAAQSRWRQVNHPLREGGDLPVRYVAVADAGSGRVVAVGRELRALSVMQQQLIEVQRAVEQDHERLRHVETRYRILFQMTNEPVLIVKASDLTISDANPAACRLLEVEADALHGRGLLTLFKRKDQLRVQSMLGEARAARRVDDVAVRLAAPASSSRFLISGSLFRQAHASYYLLRLAGGPQAPTAGAARSSFVDVLEDLPDGLVVADADLRIRLANAAFLEMAQLATVEHARGELLEQFVGRTGVDLSVLTANLREYGSVRQFATVVNGQFGSREDVELSAVVTGDNRDRFYGFSLRPAAGRRLGGGRAAAAGGDLTREGSRSVEHLTELVGRVSLKEIVRETTDLIERLCIEAALELTGDNRASAAEILGLSRQSLYAKLHRYGLGPRGAAEER